jgi:hypothetical protein
VHRSARAPCGAHSDTWWPTCQTTHAPRLGRFALLFCGGRWGAGVTT